MSNKPISVMHFSNDQVRGGAEEHLLTLLHGMDRNLFALYLVCSSKTAEAIKRDVPAHVGLFPIDLRRLRHWREASRLARLVRRLKIDILHSHMFYSSLFASPIGWFSRVPVIMETPHLSERWRHGWLKGSFVVDRLVARFVDYYIAVSEANARYLVDEKGFKARKVVVIPNSCDVSSFDPTRAAPAGMRRDLHIEAGDPVLLVLARLEPQKGHDVLLDALVAVRKEFPRVHLVCAGEGSCRPHLEAKAHSLGLAEAVHFVGYQEDVRDWLALADVVVLPSRWEGMPLVAAEALAAGKAMVATAVDGTPEIIVDGQTGLTVPPDDPRALAGAIHRLLRHPDLRREFGRAGREWVCERFDKRHQVARTQQLYLQAFALSNRSRASKAMRVDDKESAAAHQPTG